MNFSFTETELTKLYVHKVGNKTAEEPFSISNEKIELDEALKTVLCRYFLSPFKSEELYRLHHDIELSMNEVYTCIKSAFHKPDNLYKQSINLAKHLYNQSIHPQIKGGEFYVVHFKNCFLDGENLEVIGLFKSENKDTFLETEQVEDEFSLTSKQGININKLDKGCLIFKTKEEDGYVLSIVDNTNKGTEAFYWKNDFLGIAVLNNEFHQTNQFLGITKQFITKQLSEDFEVSKTDQIDYLNRSVDYFKTHESFNKSEFEKEVFADKEVIKSFRDFDQNYRNENDVELTDDFEISVQAVKKQARVFKSVLKLDKNFHIYIHGNRELIEHGTEKDGRKYYKIYYEKEN